MRISDWSSDVCSSDLLAFLPRLLRIRREQVPEIIALVPKRRGVAVGHRAGDAIIRLGEARAGLPVDLLAHVVAGVVVVARQEGFPRLLTAIRSEEHTSELQSLMRISYAVFCLKKKRKTTHHATHQ